jgi:uncharacterized protein (TIGR03437 family)
MNRMIRSAVLSAAFGLIAAAQPVVTGALNTASYAVPGLPSSGLAQGSMIAIFGRNLGPASIAQASSFPLPATLGGTSAKITSGGQTVDLVMVYSLATQVGAIVPSNTPVGNAQLTVSYNGQTSASFAVQVVASQFGIFTINQAGSGPAVVQNVNSESDRPVNTILNSAKPGQAMILWGTGLGAIQGPDNGAPPVGSLNQPIEVLVGGRPANVIYKGRSGCCAGVDQIVFEIPSGVQGCYVPLAIKNGNRVSNYTSLAIAPNGGACSDPLGYTADQLSKAQANGKLNVGNVALVKTTVKGNVQGFSIDSTTEVGVGSFVSYTADQLVASRGANGTAVSVGACSLFTYSGDQQSPTDPILPRYLDAGASINLSGPKGAKRLPKGQLGVYQETLSTSTGIPGIPGLPGLPGGGGASASYIDPGAYTADNGSGGVDVGGFRANMTIPGTFSWSNEGSIASVNRANNLQITWSNADPNGYVFVTGTAADVTAKVGTAFFCMERGSAGRLTVPSSILLAMPVSSTIEGVPTGQLGVGITNDPALFTAPGLDVGVFTYSTVTMKLLNYQ